MNEVFISYARENKEFVRRLFEALEQAGHESWVDWQGIPPSAEWLQEIHGAIAGAGAFVFVISPASLASEVCRQELDFAVQSNKRLIPLVYQEVADSEVPEPLRKLNWVFCRQTDDFESAVRTLQDAVNTDLDWVRRHTRLLLRARDWEARDRDKSFTLRAKDLKEAEEWLAEGADKEPTPNRLQTQYIIASRKAAGRRQTIMLGAVSAGLVIALVLAAIAYYQYSVSEKRRQIALSRQLAAQAAGHMDDRLDLASLLSVEAYRVYHTIEARSALLDAVVQNPRLSVFLHGHTAGVSTLAFSPDGSTLVSGSWDRTVRFWDVATGRPAAPPYTDHSNDIRSVALSPDGKILATGSCSDYAKGLCRQGEIRLIDVATHQLLHEPLVGHRDWVNSVAFSADGALLASGSPDKSIRLWDVSTGKELAPALSGHEGWVVSVAFAPEGNMLASASWDNTVRLWDIGSRKPIGPPLVGHDGWLTAVSFSPNGDMLASGSSDDTVRLWEVASGKPVGNPLRGHSHLVNQVAFGPDGNTLLSASRDGSIIQWEVATGRTISEPLTGNPNEVLSVAFGPDGKTVASGDRDGAVILWDLTRSKPLARPVATGIAPVSEIAYPQEEVLVSLGGKPLDEEDEDLTRWDLQKQQASVRVAFNASILSRALSSDGRLLATAARSKSSKGESAITVWDVATGRPVGSALVGNWGYVRSLAFDTQGKRLAAGHEDGSIALWDIATYQLLGSTLSGHEGDVADVAFSADGKLLASGGDDTTVRLWDLANDRAIGDPLVGHVARVTCVAFSHDGGKIASSSAGKTSDENAMIIWDVKTRRMHGSALIGQKAVQALAFGPSDQILAAAHDDGTTTLLDASTGRSLGVSLGGFGSSTNSIQFDPQGVWLASAGGDITAGRGRSEDEPARDGWIVLWDVRIDSWIKRACTRANRNLSPADEWRQYLPDEEYRNTCVQ